MGMAYNSSKIARRTSQAVSQREKNLKTVEKKHARRASEVVSKKLTVKAAKKKQAKKTQHDANGDKGKCRSQARKNQSEEKFRKAYGEDDHRHDAELEEEPVDLNISTAKDLEEDTDAEEFFRNVESRLERIYPGLVVSLDGRAHLVEELERHALAAAREYRRAEAAALWRPREEAEERKCIAKVLDSHFTEIPIESLTEEDRQCPLCMETMGTASKYEEAERAVHMPLCGKHACGSRRLSEWLEDHHTCPLCRHDYRDDLNELIEIALPDSNINWNF
jgi:hypothetical protein